MSFTGITNFYNIPYGKDGDTIQEPDNQQQAQMIDWLLQAATGVSGNGIIQEGDYNQAPDSGSGISVFVNPTGGNSIRAAFKSALASSSSTIIWRPLVDGNFYYLYIKWSNTLFTNPASFTTEFTTTPYPTSNRNYLLLATYDLTGGYPGVIDSYPDGKMYASGFTDHMAERINPHSPFLTQTNLTITGSCHVGLDTAESFDVNQPVGTSSAPLFYLRHANASVPLFFTTGEFIVQDTRIKTQLSETGESSFDNGKSSIVGAINDNTTNIDSNSAAISLNTTHRSSDGTDHADVVANNNHRTGDGTDHSQVSTNAFDISTHTADTVNPHATSLANIDQGTLSDLNSNISDATLDDISNPRIPIDHAITHVNGDDDIPNATTIQKGLATSTHINDISLNNNHRSITGNPHGTIADEISYNNYLSGLSAMDIQSAIDELAYKLEMCCPTISSSSSSSSSNLDGSSSSSSSSSSEGDFDSSSSSSSSSN